MPELNVCVLPVGTLHDLRCLLMWLPYIVLKKALHETPAFLVLGLLYILKLSRCRLLDRYCFRFVPECKRVRDGVNISSVIQQVRM